jgi:hypothetical protein
VADSYSEWTISGNYIYFTFPAIDAGTAVARIATDGSQYQVLAIESEIVTNDVAVSTTAELIAAIASDTRITLSEGKYDLSEYFKAKPYPQNLAPHTLSVHGVSNLTLQAEPGAAVEIVTSDPFSEVLSFRNCSSISLRGIKAGHSLIIDYECDSGVSSFTNTNDIRIEDCYFFGCGSMGIDLNDCSGALIQDTIVTDCSLYAVHMRDCTDIDFSNCSFTDHRAYMSILYITASKTSFIDCTFSGNKNVQHGIVWEDSYDVGYAQRTPRSVVSLERCIFTDNAPSMSVSKVEPVINAKGVSLKDCVIEKGTFRDYWVEIIDLGGNELK